MINKWYAGFYDALQALDQVKFHADLIKFCYMVTPLIILGAVRVYLTGWLGLTWRQWVTDVYLTKYLKHNAFLQLETQNKQTDNPDQRLSYDLQQITSESIGILMTLVHEVTTIVMFSSLLWGISQTFNPSVFGVPLQGYLFWCSFGFSLIGTLVVMRVGTRLTKLQFHQERYEAGFRFGLMRVREWRDSIALLDGKQAEQQSLTGKFAHIITNFMQLLKVNVTIDLTQSVYFQTMMVFPYFVASPMLFTKVITYGVLVQVAHAFGIVNGSMSTIIQIYPILTAWRATSERVVQMHQDIHAVHAFEPEIGYEKATNNCIRFKQVSLYNQAGQTIFSDLNLELAPGDKVLMMAPSGYGKSTLTKALAKTWPYASGHIDLPQAEIFFLPQKSYMPIASLRDALCYPDDAVRYGDARLCQVLEQVDLANLESHLDEVKDWANTLSLGEQQRLGFARVLLKQPQCIVLDEPSSALDHKRQQRLFGLLFDQLSQATILTIGHNQSLIDLHDRTIDLVADCGGNLQSATESN